MRARPGESRGAPDKNTRVEKETAMTGIKLELLGIGVILAGIAMSIPNFYAYLGGAVGIAIIAGGFFWKDRRP